MNQTTSHHAAPRSSPGRTAALIGGCVAAFVSLLLLAIGGAALWGNAQKDDQGYLSTGADPYATSTHALTTESLEIDSGDVGSFLDDAVYGKLRLKAESRTDEPVFVGIARTSDVSAYLRGTSYAEVTDVDFSPFHADYRTVGGGRPAPPAEQPFWATSTHGPGQQTLNWDVKEGDWSVVVMNADGSSGVDAEISAGAEVPILSPLGWTALGAGLLLAISAAGLLYAGARGIPGGVSRRRRPDPLPHAA